MKIVIDLPDELVEDVLNDGVLYADYEGEMRKAIKNALPVIERENRYEDNDKSGN